MKIFPFSAPTAYAPEKAGLHLKHSPAFSFGLKILKERQSDTPGKGKAF